ncbi:MAG: AAA family ATPase [Rubrivivax sp.]|nr:AAA family ATPase [Rubrivivax sp.]
MTEPAADQPPPPLRLLGAAHWLAGGERRDLPDSLPGYLVCHLAYRGDWVSREALAGLFWPERAEEEAQHNLRANLHRVRTLLQGWGEAAALQAERRRIRLDLPTDVAAFRAALGRADWTGAVALHPGPLLAAMTFRGFTLVEEWARSERQALAEAWRDASLKAALGLEQAGEPADACALLVRLLQAEPGTEDAVQALLRVAAAAGRRDEALAAFERFRRWLAAELGLQPMAATAALADTLRLGQRLPARAPAASSPPAANVPRAVIQPPRVVGREREREFVADTSRRLVAVGGEPGVGKTRLLEDALPGARWIACREGLSQVALAPLIEYLQDFADSLPELGEYRLDLARLVPALSHGELPPPADPTLAKPRLLAGLARVLEHERRPLVFDDVQWADAATAELMVFLARRAEVPLRLAHRSTEATPALDELLGALQAWGLERMLLAPLSAEALQALLAELSRSAAGPLRFTAWLHARTGGNPFFALQMLRALFESRRLAATATGWASDLDAVTIDYSELEVPAQVAELVQRRLRGLSDGARRVLGVVAVCGHAREVERIGATIGLSPWATAEALAEAESAGLLREGRFAHDLVRESHLAGLPAPLREAMHAAVARQFDQTMPPEQVAAHWWAAGQPEPALEATLRAVEHCRHGGLHAQALQLLAHAAARLDAGPRGAAAGAAPLGARLHAARAHVCLEMADLEGAEAAAGAVLAETMAEPRERAAAWRARAALAMQSGRLDDAGRALHEAALAEPDSLALQVDRGKLANLQGRVAEVIPALEAQRDRMRRERPGPELVRCLTSLGAAYDELGDVARGLPLHEEAYRLAQRLGARYAQVDVAINLLWALAALKRDEEGITLAREALALGEYDGTPTLRNNLAWSLTELGRLDEASEVYTALADGADPTLALIARARLVDLHHRLGRAELARAMASKVVATLGSTEVGIAHATAAINLLQHGDAAQVQAALGALKPAGLDPWLRERLRAALVARGIDPLPYVGEAGQAPQRTSG